MGLGRPGLARLYDEVAPSYATGDTQELVKISPVRVPDSNNNTRARALPGQGSCLPYIFSGDCGPLRARALYIIPPISTCLYLHKNIPATPDIARMVSRYHKHITQSNLQTLLASIDQQVHFQPLYDMLVNAMLNKMMHKANWIPQDIIY